MNPIDERILRFIGRHHVMTIASVGAAGEPYCANLFYSYMAEDNLFVFTTEEKTRHYGEMLRNEFVAASIVLETKTVGKVQGLQLQGRARLAEEAIIKRARRSYIRRFPYAAIADLTLWTLSPTFMKLTDNTLGFGKKLIWNGTGETSSQSSGNGGDGDDRQPSGGGAGQGRL